jgi:hypothetical protein
LDAKSRLHDGSSGFLIGQDGLLTLGVAEKVSAYSLRFGQGVHQLLTLKNHYFANYYKGNLSFLNFLINGKWTKVSSLECEEFV